MGEQPKKIVYLFGAGATHAELVNLYQNEFTDETFRDKNSLLMDSVSRRVCSRAKGEGILSGKLHNLLSPVGLSNIELFIGLLEKNEIRSEQTINDLKSMVQKDITSQLTKERRGKFHLHKALFELHAHVEGREKLLGMISLNYDQVIDEAYQAVEKKIPNYCLLFGEPAGGKPLLKLHGGFNVEYRGKRLPILTPGINKNYLELPYNYIWGRALELLIDCDVLRVIGCSLSQNDLGLVDLLFKAHLARPKPFKMQMIDFDPPNNRIRQSYGFLPDIEPARRIEGGIKGGLISDVSIADPTIPGVNPFKIWLRAKIERMIPSRNVSTTKFIKKVLQ